MHYWSLSPVWLIDFCGSALMIYLSAQCLYLVRKLLRKDEKSPLANYLFWFIGAIFAFSVSRSLGHIIKHLLYFSGHSDLWQQLAPVSGSINSITFIVIASVTLFFHRMESIMEQMNRDRERLEKTSQEILELNKHIDSLVFERTKEELALRIAHEVRNPAMIIGGLLRRLYVTASDDCFKEKERLQKVIEQAQKLETIVTGFERMRPSVEKAFSPMELNELVEDTLDIVQPEADQKNITIVLNRSSGPLTMQGNGELLKIAILHILRNAIEAGAAGDTVHVSTELTNRGICLKVQDDGPGIPQKLLQHIYEPFYSTVDGETGLGIPYAKQIVTEHQGSILITSSERVGTTVEIDLPTHFGMDQNGMTDYQI